MDSKLIGHLLLALKANSGSQSWGLLGQRCTFHGKGHHTTLKTEQGAMLTPLNPFIDQPQETLASQEEDLEPTTPVSRKRAADARTPQGKAKKARLAAGRAQKKELNGGTKSAPEGLLQHLQTLSARERLHMPAFVVDVLDVPDGATKATLVLVSVDVYFPFAIWEGRREWRGSPSALAVLRHISCDWEARTKILERVAEREGNANENQVLRRGKSTVEKGKWKVDSWSDLQPEAAILDKPPGVLRIREPEDCSRRDTIVEHPAPDSQLLSKALKEEAASLQGVQRVVGECQVLGCKLHVRLPPDEQKARFNLPTLFRSLPSHLDELQGLVGKTATCMLPDGEPTGAGIYDLDDEMLILIMSKLASSDLQRMEAVCKHTRALGAALFPSISLPLFQHQRAAARWMVERERNAGSFFSPLFRRLISDDGFILYANLVTGEVSPEEPPLVVDGRGGLVCDEPGMGKTATSLAVIMKSLGTRAIGPPEYPSWFVKYEGMADGQAGYYVLPGGGSSKLGSSVRRRKSLYSSFAPSTPQTDLPRGRLMSDLKAISDPNPSKVCEQKGSLDDIRRSLFEGDEAVASEEREESFPVENQVAIEKALTVSQTEVEKGETNRPNRPAAGCLALAAFAPLTPANDDEPPRKMRLLSDLDRGAKRRTLDGSKAGTSGKARTGTGGVQSDKRNRRYKRLCEVDQAKAARIWNHGSLEGTDGLGASECKGRRENGGESHLVESGWPLARERDGMRWEETENGLRQGESGKAFERELDELAECRAALEKEVDTLRRQLRGANEPEAASEDTHSKDNLTAQETLEAETHNDGFEGAGYAPDQLLNEGSYAVASQSEASRLELSTPQETDRQKSNAFEEGDLSVRIPELLRASRRNNSAGDVSPAPCGSPEAKDSEPFAKVRRISFVFRPKDEPEKVRGREPWDERDAMMDEPPREILNERARYEGTFAEKPEERGKADIDLGARTDEIESKRWWVECEACHKWRKLPPGCPKPSEDSGWFCSMNKDILRQDCNVPSEEVVDEELLTSPPGFTASGEEPGSAENVAYFLENLRAHLPALNTSWRAVRWLSDLSAADLQKLSEEGLLVPWMRRDADYVTVFCALGLEQCSKNDVSLELGTERTKLSPFERQYFKKVEAERAKSHLWRYPRHVAVGWSFDIAALKVALSTPVEEAKRIYLSKATLVVVPSNLIQHWLFQIKKHTPSEQLRVHVWDGCDSKSPSPHKLAWDFDIVLTTFNRLSAEWVNKGDSTLMQVHWLRVMLDEGHTLGASLSMTNKVQMTIALRADRRWVLTGTPTPNTPNSQVAHLHPLLKFLHEGCYGEQQKVWESAIQKPFEAQREEGRLRLEELLMRTMISATKQDMKTIPACERKLVMLDFDPAHAKSYNELVGTAKRNLLLADWNDPNHVESLLNPKQWKLARDTVINVRKSCCVAGNMMIEDTPYEIKETMDDLHSMLSTAGLTISNSRADAIRSALKSGGSCDRCSQWSRLPIITPCAHLLCISCVSLNATHCTMPGCFKPYKMQQKGRRAENPNPRGPVPQDLIELQPSYTQAVWNPDWQSSKGSKLVYLIRCLKRMVAQNQRACMGIPGDLELNESLGQVAETGEANLGDQEGGRGLGTVAERASWQMLDPRVKERPIDWTGGLGAETSTSPGAHRQPEKAIVFSEFLEYLMLVEDQLLAAGIKSAPMYSPKTHLMKMQALSRFQEDPSCCVLVMDGSAAVGLDLSFVGRVYLMEPIWDKSLEEQVVSRAWRMGATRPIKVETLAMRGTIEEEMVHVLQGQDDASGKSHREAQELNARISCLSRLSPVEVLK